MKIIFLDIDGVLNSMAYFEQLRKPENVAHRTEKYCEISDFHLQMLAKIYHTCHAQIVLTSTWRQLTDVSDESCCSMYQYLVDSLAKYDMEIMSKTPVINLNRPLEIITWLNNRADKDDIQFVILDDDFSEKEYQKYGLDNHLVHTNYFCMNLYDGGLQQNHVNKAISILNNEVDL